MNALEIVEKKKILNKKNKFAAECHQKIHKYRNFKESSKIEYLCPSGGIQMIDFRF